MMIHYLKYTFHQFLIYQINNDKSLIYLLIQYLNINLINIYLIIVNYQHQLNFNYYLILIKFF